MKDFNLTVPRSKGQFLKGKNHPYWKGGRYNHNSGYIMIYKPDHIYCNKGGYIMEHRLIFEEYMTQKWGIKFILHPSILIHHIDGNKENNIITNLEPLTLRKHMSIHKKGNTNGKKDMSGRKCLQCNSPKTFINNKGNNIWYKYKDGFICSSCFSTNKYRRKNNITQLTRNCIKCNKIFNTFLKKQKYCTIECCYERKKKVVKII